MAKVIWFPIEQWYTNDRKIYQSINKYFLHMQYIPIQF